MIHKLLCAILFVCLFLTACAPRGAEPEVNKTSAFPGGALSVESVENMSFEMRGAWIASVYNINFPSAPDLTEVELKTEIDSIVETAKNSGLNTLFFQAHPSADALYRSSLFPVSRFLSTQTKELLFDPFEYFVDCCHRSDIALYAWINPLRVTTETFESRDQAIGSLDPDIGAGTMPELLVFYNDGKLYYDPGAPEVADLVSDCVKEIVSGYDVDGVVFDDYFYPYPSGEEDFDDKETYEQYSNGLSLADWRRQNINSIIKKSYETVKAIDPDCAFGVSPFGIWRNNDGTNGGSDTSGFEGYASLYCDALAWADGGYVDFISPQIYWSSDDSLCPYDVICDWWNRVLDGTGVDFIPSLASYKYDDGWTDPAGIIEYQTEYGRNSMTYRGYVCYGFAQIVNDSHGLSGELAALNRKQYIYYDSVRYPRDLRVDSPITGTVFSEKTVTLCGVSQPDLPLYINDSPVSRSVGGNFEAKIILSPGENLVTIKCGSEKKELILYLK